jgi:hypothetical protein
MKAGAMSIGRISASAVPARRLIRRIVVTPKNEIQAPWIINAPPGVWLLSGTDIPQRP